MTGPWSTPGAQLILPADAAREDWLEARRQGLGGSDAATVVGLNPYSDPYTLWMDKTVGLPDQEPSSAMEWGNRLEGVVAQWLSEHLGLEMRRSGLLRSREWPELQVTPDRLSADGGIVEIKTTNWRQADLWADGQIPDAAELQIQHTLAVTGRSHAHAAVLVDGRDPLYRRVQRDDRLIADLVRIERAWWARHITAGEPPAVTGADSCTDTLNSRWSALVDTDPTIVDAGTLDLVADYHAAHAAAKAAEEAKTLAGNRLRARLGDHTAAELEDGTKVATWKRNGTFSTGRFTAAEPALVAEYTQLVTTERLDVDGIKRDHPDLYEQHRARVLRPAKIK